jgi:hypothetical protein
MLLAPAKGQASMRTRKFAALTLPIASALVALSSAAAHAQYGEEEYAPDPTAPLYTTDGIGITIGGGVENFTNDRAENTTELAGSWDVRVEVGTRLPLSLEAAYVGTAQTIQGLTTDQDATLVGTTVEGALKFNVTTRSPLRPFIFAGMGWRRYDTTDANFSTAAAGIAEKDDLLVFPLGAGLRYDYRGFDADVRITYRPAIGADLISDPIGSDGVAALHTWAIGAHIGANL